MDFLLVIIMFTVDPVSGELGEPLTATKPFWTLEECNMSGQNIRSVMDLPAEIKSVSYCVRKEEFDKELKR